MRKLRPLAVAAVALLGVVIVLGIIPKTRFLMLALARSESFLDQKPVSHWAHDLADEDPEVRARAARMLGNLTSDSRRAVPELGVALHDPDDNVRIQSALALYKIGPASVNAVNDLAAAVSDPHPQVRINSVLALTTLDGDAQPAVPALIKALTESGNSGLVMPIKLSVRGQAARALAKIGPAASDAVPALTEVLMDPDPAARRNAATALGRMGAAALPARPKLEACLGDEDETVRQEVAKCLALIDKVK